MKDAIVAICLLVLVATLFFLGIESLAKWRTWSEPRVWILTLLLTFLVTFRLGTSNKWIAGFSAIASVILAVAFAIGLHDTFHLTWAASVGWGFGILFGLLVLAQPGVAFGFYQMSQR